MRRATDQFDQTERVLAFWTYGVLLANGLCALAFLALFFRHQIAALSLAAAGVLVGVGSIAMHRRAAHKTGERG